MKGFVLRWNIGLKVHCLHHLDICISYLEDISQVAKFYLFTLSHLKDNLSDTYLGIKVSFSAPVPGVLVLLYHDLFLEGTGAVT